MHSVAVFFIGLLIVLVSLFMVLLILIQRGKGGGITGALGGAGGQSAFGSKAGDVFTRVTVVVASIWIFLCMLLIVVANRPPKRENPNAKTESSVTGGTGSTETGTGTGTGTGETALPTGEGDDSLTDDDLLPGEAGTAPPDGTGTTPPVVPPVDAGTTPPVDTAAKTDDNKTADPATGGTEAKKDDNAAGGAVPPAKTDGGSAGDTPPGGQTPPPATGDGSNGGGPPLNSGNGQ